MSVRSVITGGEGAVHLLSREARELVQEGRVGVAIVIVVVLVHLPDGTPPLLFSDIPWPLYGRFLTVALWPASHGREHGRLLLAASMAAGATCLAPSKHTSCALRAII
jgi:hypothetical protein